MATGRVPMLDADDRIPARFLPPVSGGQVTNHGAQAGPVTLAAGTNTITLAGDVSLTVPALADGAELTVFVQQDGTGGRGLSWGGVVWQSGDGQPATDADVISTFLLIGSVFGTLGYTAGSGTGGGGGDTTPPVPGTLTASSITQTGFSLAVSGASDDTALHAAPYRFTTNGGTTWSAWQSSALYAASGLTAATVYQCQHEVRDAAGNVASGTVVPVTTSAAAADLAVTFLGSFAEEVTQATYTYANAPLGTASGSRRIIIGFSCRGGSNSPTPPALTVGGVAAARITQAGTATGASNGVWLYVADVPTGTTGDIVATLPGTAFRAGISVWSTDVPVAFVSQDFVPAAPATSWSMTSAATSAQAVVGLAITAGTAPTLTPAVDGSHVLGAGYSFHAWHKNGEGHTQQISGMASTVGQGLQVTLGSA